MNNKQFARRTWGVVLVLAILMTFLCSNLYTLQYTNGAEYAAQSVAKVAETQIVEAERGAILDRNGTVLVSNEISYQVLLDPALMGTPEERCATLLTLIRVAREEGVLWDDTLPITHTEPFAYTVPDPFYTVSTDEKGNPVYNMTRLGRLAVYQKWIRDPEKQSTAQQTPEKPGLWERFLGLFGLGDTSTSQAPSPTEDPSRLPTAEELLGKICRSFAIKGQGAVDEKKAKQTGETVPTLNIGDMKPSDARAVAGLMFELNYRSRINSWPPYVFASDVNIDFITRVKELQLPGIEIETVTVRQYNTPYAAHLLGTTGPIYREDWEHYEALGGYTMDDIVGKAGAEYAFEEYLRGTSGQRTIERNERGKVISSVWLKDEDGNELSPKPGQNVFLTIDIGLQQKVEETLANGVAHLQSKEAEGAACVMLDVDTGEVLASASYPTFSLETYYQDYDSISKDPLNPLYNRALQGLYPPGSTFKMIAAIAGLEEGLITPTTKIKDEGIYTYWPSPQPKCWIYRQGHGTHGNVNVSDAIEVSCNYFFYEVGHRLGIEKLDEYAAKFGLGQKTGIELYEYTGALASPEYSKSVGQKWYEGNILSAVIGQENNQSTPIQLANYIATLVNGGTRYSTHLLKSVKSGDFSKVVHTYQPQVLSTIEIKDQNLNAVKAGMLALTTKKGPVAHAFRNLPVQAGAKTGSAQVSIQTESNAVFVCFAPFDNPQVAMAIAVEHGGSGSELAAMAAEILQYYFSAQGEQGRIPVENTLIP